MKPQDMADQPQSSAESATALIQAERRRQIEVEGWTPAHDDEHADGEMAVAASLYYRMAHGDAVTLRDDGAPLGWPWDAKWWKPKGAERNFVIAGALYLAERDRLRRLPGSYGLKHERAARMEPKIQMVTKALQHLLDENVPTVAQPKKVTNWFDECAKQAGEAFRYWQALERITAIENKDFGSDWEEIEEAREIARAALASQPSPAATVATKSAPDGSAPHNSGERLPSSDAADTGAGTQCSAGNDELIQHLQCYENGDHLVYLKAEQIDRIIGALSTQPQPLPKPILSFVKEVAGAWGAFEYDIRNAIGNTNYAVVQEKLDAALALTRLGTPEAAAKPAAWMSREHIEAYMAGNTPGIAWASPQQTDFFDVALYAAGAIERAAGADQIIGQIEERFPNWRSYRDLIDCIDCTLRSLRTINEPQGSWVTGEREAVARAVFGDGWKSCANLGPYVQSVVNELNVAREILATMPEDLVEHQRDLLQQTSQLTRPGPG